MQEVAILDLPDYYRVGNHVDHHRDMRMDIEDMSYEVSAQIVGIVLAWQYISVCHIERERCNNIL